MGVPAAGTFHRRLSSKLSMVGAVTEVHLAAKSFYGVIFLRLDVAGSRCGAAVDGWNFHHFVDPQAPGRRVIQTDRSGCGLHSF